MATAGKRPYIAEGPDDGLLNLPKTLGTYEGIADPMQVDKIRISVSNLPPKEIPNEGG